MSQAPNPSTKQLAASSSNLSALAKEIYQSLNADKADLQSLTKLLSDERQVLESREPESISDYAEQKSTLVNRMEQRNTLRAKLLRAHHLAASGQQGWADTIATLQHSTSDPITALWAEMEGQLKHCRDMLQINERIIGTMQQSVSRFLNILRGQTGSGQTYNATGQAESYSDPTPIVRA